MKDATACLSYRARQGLEKPACEVDPSSFEHDMTSMFRSSPAHPFVTLLTVPSFPRCRLSLSSGQSRTALDRRSRDRASYLSGWWSMVVKPPSSTTRWLSGSSFFANVYVVSHASAHLKFLDVLWVGCGYSRSGRTSRRVSCRAACSASLESCFR